MGKKRFENLKKAGVTAAVIAALLLLFVLLSGMGKGEPDNPMKEKEADASRMYRTTSTLVRDESKLEEIENANINAGDSGDEVSEKEEESEEEEQEEEEQEEQQEQEQPPEETPPEELPPDVPQTSSPTQISANSPLTNTLEQLINKKTSDRAQDSTQPGTSPGESDTPGQSGQYGGPGGEVRVASDASKYFDTSIEDGAELEEEEYAFRVWLTEEGKKLRLESRTVYVNGNSFVCHEEQTIFLKEGANEVMVLLQFRDSDNNRIKAAKSYTLYYVPDEHFVLTLQNAETGDYYNDGDSVTVDKRSMVFNVVARQRKNGQWKNARATFRCNAGTVNASSDGRYRVEYNSGSNTVQVKTGTNSTYGQTITCEFIYQPAEDEMVIDFDRLATGGKIVKDVIAGRELLTDNVNDSVKFSNVRRRVSYESTSEAWRFRVSSSLGPDSITDILVQTRFGITPVKANAGNDGFIGISLDPSGGGTKILIKCVDSRGRSKYYTYQVEYVRQIDPEENARRRPIIETNLSNEKVYKSPYIMAMNAYDYRGNTLYPSSWTVWLNGREIDFTGISGGAYEYTLYLLEGSNTLRIYAIDNEQYETEVEYTIIFDPEEQALTVSVKVSANVVGLGTFFEETISVPSGSTVAQIVEDRLAAYGYTTVYDGSPTGGGYFLRHVRKAGIANGYFISDDERTLVTEEG